MNYDKTEGLYILYYEHTALYFCQDLATLKSSKVVSLCWSMLFFFMRNCLLLISSHFSVLNPPLFNHCPSNYKNVMRVPDAIHLFLWSMGINPMLVVFSLPLLPL